MPETLSLETLLQEVLKYLDHNSRGRCLRCQIREALQSGAGIAH